MDLNGDGKKDVISGSYPGQLYLFTRKNSGAFADGIVLNDKKGLPLNMGRATTVAIADWDGDGDLDMVVGNMDGAVYSVINEGTTTKPLFGTPKPIQAAGKALTVSDLAGPCIADWDNDGLIDLLVGDGKGAVGFYKNVGTKTEPKLSARVELISQSSASNIPSKLDNPERSGMRVKISTCDWNQDGLLDLLVGDFSSDRGKYHGWVWVYQRTQEAEKK